MPSLSTQLNVDANESDSPGVPPSYALEVSPRTAPSFALVRAAAVAIRIFGESESKLATSMN